MVKQWPKLGVKTKFKKHATTFFIEVSEIIQVVKAWDYEVRQAGSKFWFAHISSETGQIDPSVFSPGSHRDVIARKNLKDWLSRVGLPYHSPHKFRHGHAVYSIKQAKDIPTLKAISQNLMHANLSVTDGVYGILSDNDVKGKISQLGKSGR
jgi:integrase